ncbi:lysophospholipid acyltransferase family protein [Lapillicoccus jejuensis]
MSRPDPAAVTPRVPTARQVEGGRRFGRVLLGALWRCEAHHRERVPAGPVVLVANHSGFLDGPLVFSLAPRGVSFLVKQQMFTGPLGRVLRTVGQIPIDRSRGDRSALGVARAVLERGGAVGVFPEGTRGRGDVAQVNQGAAWLALQAGAQVVPVAVLGTRRAGASTGSLPRVRTRVVVDFGEPFDLAPDRALPGRERLRAATERLRDRLAEHVTTASATYGLVLPDDGLVEAGD